jgi:hypothetical protein
MRDTKDMKLDETWGKDVRSGVDNKDGRENQDILQGSRLRTKTMGTTSFIIITGDSRTRRTMDRLSKNVK